LPQRRGDFGVGFARDDRRESYFELGEKWCRATRCIFRRQSLRLGEARGLSTITALRTVGFSDNHLYGASRPIRKDIHTHHKAIGCVVCGSHSDLVTDHKNDLYNDPRVLDAKTQTLDDFQCLCNHCNLQKRQVSKTTKETGVRFSAMRIPSLAIWGVGFVDGDETFDADDVMNAMVGTYWHDPVEFMKKLKTIVS